MVPMVTSPATERKRGENTIPSPLGSPHLGLGLIGVARSGSEVWVVHRYYNVPIEDATNRRSRRPRPQRRYVSKLEGQY